MDPNPGTAYFNLCATLYNQGDMQGAISAFDRAITADPLKTDAYFIKGVRVIWNGNPGLSAFVLQSSPTSSGSAGTRVWA